MVPPGVFDRPQRDVDKALSGSGQVPLLSVNRSTGDGGACLPGSTEYSFLSTTSVIANEV
jgi:hypothetical protein